MQKQYGKVGFIITNFVRLLLVIELIIGVRESRSLIISFSLIALLSTFIPSMMQEFFKIKPRAESHIIILLIIYGMLFIGEVRGILSYFWWWGILLNLLAATALGFVGLTIVTILHKEEVIEASPVTIIILSFSLAFSMGGVIEIIQLLLDNIFSFNLQTIGTGGTSGDLIVNAIGAFIVSFGGYLYTKYTKKSILSKIVSNFMKKNANIFKSKKYIENPSEEIKSLIKKGEDQKMEFKSTLRVNLHTNQVDKNVELAVLKTIVAYLNTDGGILLVGVSDNGEITGLEKDAFENNDKLKLHLANLIKQHIGRQFFPFIKYELFPVDDRHVLKIDCLESNKQVFLKIGKDEEFFIRNGPSTARLSGSSLVDYISHRFKE